ncbi:MAG: TRAM domain-containing protein [Treponema sp.]|nr:TRAM domain-containing protein [Treponema sp.]
MALVTIVADKMTFGGNCLAKNNGKAVFIPFAIPGETLQVEITESKRDYDTAKIVSIITPSPHRIEPTCPLYGTCGGCNMMHIDAAYQRQLRADILKDCFEREGITVPPVASLYDQPLGYRSRFQLHNGALTARASNTEIPILNCPVAVNEINTYLEKTPLSQRPRGRVHLFGGAFATPSLVVAQETHAQTQQESTQIKSGKRTIKKKVNRYFSGTTLHQQNIITAQIAGKPIQFDVQGFFQSNISVLEKTIAVVCDGLSGKNVLDMYAGAGTFSVFLADLFEKVTLVEHNRDALVFAEINLAGKKHESYGLSGAKWIKENADAILQKQGNFDAVVIDPPRSGMEKEVNIWLCKTKPHIIKSVSCDPATHARDAAALIKAGYKLDSLYLLDFYPQTSHIESLATFVYQ